MERVQRRLSLALGALFLAMLVGGGFLVRSAGQPSLPRSSPDLPVARADTGTPIPTPGIEIPKDADGPVPSETPPPPEPAQPRPAPPPVPPTVPISGSLLDEDGRPVPFARVECYSLGMRGVFTKVVSETDEKGAFRVDCPAWSRVTFTAHLPGHGRAFYFNLQVTDLEHLALATTETAMRFTAATTFEGTLLHDAGPVVGTRLRFHPMSHPSFEGTPLNLLGGSIPPNERWDEQCERELYLTDCEVFANAAGEFRADSLLPGVRYVVEAFPEGREPFRFEMNTQRPGRRTYRGRP